MRYVVDREILPAALVAKLRAAAALEGAEITVPAGDFLFGASEPLLPAARVTIRGQGAGRTCFVHGDDAHSASWACFGPATYQDLTLESKPPLFTNQALCVGWAGQMAPLPLRLVRVAAIGCGGFCLYSWGPQFVQAEAIACEFFAGRWVSTAGVSSGATAQSFRFRERCIIRGDFAAFGGGGGEQGQQTLGSVAVGGWVAHDGTVFRMRGYPGFDLVASVRHWRTNPSKTGWPFTILVECESHVEQNGAIEAWDIVADSGTVLVLGGIGSGPDGTWRVKPGLEGDVRFAAGAVRAP